MLVCFVKQRERKKVAELIYIELHIRYNFVYFIISTLVNICSQIDYICYDFVRRHHNVIRFRRGVAVIKDDFHTVCSWVQFPNTESWRYDIYLGNITIYYIYSKVYYQNAI